MNISIIIPNYNGEKLLKKNLPRVLFAVKGYKKGKIEIIIADDLSTDDSPEIITNFIGEIKDTHITGKIIRNNNKTERGFSKNVNRAAGIATGDILVLLNTDIYPRIGFLDPLLKHFNDESVFAVGCMDESIESGKTVMRGRGVGSWQRGFFVHNAGDTTKTSTLWVSGGSGAFRKSIWAKLNGLDILYNPFYWEDIDLSYRALKAGYKNIFEPKSIVVHEHEKGTIKTQYTKNQIKKIAYRNQFIFIWKNITQIKLLFSHFVWLPYHFLKAFTSRDSAFFLGFLLALFKLSQISYARQLARKNFVRTDAEILKENFQ